MTAQAATSGGNRLRWAINLIGALGALGVQAMLWLASYGFRPRQPIGDEGRYMRDAAAIWAGRAPPPDFVWPGGQEWFLAPLLGLADGRLWLAQLVQTLLLLLAAACLRQLWQRLDPRPLAADLAFWLMLTSPAIMAFGFYMWPEPLHLCLMLGAMWLLACHGRSLPACAAAGAALALALLSKSLLSAFWPAFLLLLLRWPLTKTPWRPLLAFVAAFTLVIGPSLWQGYQATGKPLVADSSVYNLYVGLQDHWRSDYVQGQGGTYMREYLLAGDGPRQRNAAFGERVQQSIATQGGLLATLGARLQVQYFRLFNAKRTVLSMLPGAPCAGYRGAYRVPAHWVTAIQVLTRGHYLLVLVLAAFGLVLWRRPQPLLWLVLLFFAYQLLLYLGLHVKARYLLPMLPFLGGFAASATASLLAVPGTSEVLHASRPRLLLATLLAALLLFLACAGPWLDKACAAAGVA